jgi:hypothetical protein
MKKKLVLILSILTFILALSMTACDFGGDDSTVEPEITVDDSWSVIEAPTPTDVYNKFLSGFMNVATDFSVSSLESSPFIGADAKLKVSINGIDLWTTFKGNYNNNNRSNAMFAFEISTVEDSYDDIIAAIYLYDEVMFVTLGDSQFKFAMYESQWDSMFPFELALDNSKEINNMASFLYLIFDIEDDVINGKTRLNGLVEEYNYNFSLDLAGTLTKVQSYLDDSDSSDDIEILNRINQIFSNILGVTLDDVSNGRVPDAQLDMDFTVANTKISDLNLSVHIDQSGEYANSLFDGEDVDVDVELITMETSKSSISIDFVNSTEKQSEFLSYIEGDYTFKINLDMNKVSDLETGDLQEYTLVLTTKVFQEDSTNNYFMIEFTNIDTSVVEKAIYFYGNEMYIFDTVDNDLVCLGKLDLDLTQLATNIYDNNLGSAVEEEADFLNIITYIIGALKIESDTIKVNFTEKFFTQIWYNYESTLDYINNQVVEDLAENADILAIESFISENNSICTFDLDQEFIFLVDDTDDSVVATIDRITNCTPIVIYTPVGSEEEVEE